MIRAKKPNNNEKYWDTFKPESNNTVIDSPSIPTDNQEVPNKTRNHLLLLLTYVTVIIVFLVIFLAFDGDYLKGISYIDKDYVQPTNNIIGIIKKEKEDDTKDDDKNKDKGKDKDKNTDNNNNDNNEEPGGNENPTEPEEGETNVIFENYIYMTNQFPITDEVGKSLEGEFKMQDIKAEFSSADVGRTIEVTLEKMDTSDLDDDWVKVYLTKNGSDISNCYRSSGRIKTFNEYTKVNGNNNVIMMYSGTITSQDYANQFSNFRLKMWISEDVNVVNANYESKTFVAKVTVTIHD